jgi:hypothetical protein
MAQDSEPNAGTFWSRLPVAAQAAAGVLGAVAALVVAIATLTNAFKRGEEPVRGDAQAIKHPLEMIDVAQASTEPRAANGEGAATTQAPTAATVDPGVPYQPARTTRAAGTRTSGVPAEGSSRTVRAVSGEPQLASLPDETFPRRAVLRQPRIRSVSLLLGPSGTSGYAGAISQGETVFSGKEENGWLRVKTNGGVVGYVRSEMLTIIDN